MQPDEIFSVSVQDADIGDFYVPVVDGEPQPLRAWRIGYNRRYVHPRHGVIHDLYGPDGETEPYFRASEGTQIHIARDEDPVF